MLSNIRKYTGLMFAVLILLFVGLVFLESGGNKQGAGSGPVIVEIDGRGYPKEDFDRKSTSPLRLLSDLGDYRRTSFQGYSAVNQYLYQVASPASGNPNEHDPRLFLINRLIIQQTAKDLGLHPSVAEIEKFVRERIFVNQDQTFNAEGYTKYIKKDLPRLGMSVKDMNDVLSEILVLERLQDILGSGLTASRDSVEENIADTQQEISYKIVAFPASKHEAEESPTDEEVKTYWEENRGRYLSEEKRRVSYIIGKPDFDALLEKKKATAAAEPAAEDAPTAEGETPAAGDTPETPEEEVVLSNEENDNAIMAEGVRIDHLWEQLRQDDGNGFEEKSVADSYEFKTTKLFTKNTCPPEFRTATQGIKRSRAVDIIFEASIGTKPMDAISDAHRLGADQWFVFRIDEVIEAKELEFEEAKNEANLDLVQERARTKMVEVAEAARTKLLAAIAGGKSFDDAAKEQGLEPVSRDAVKRDTRTPGEPTPQEIFNLASKVNPGETSEILTQNNDTRSVYRALFVHVDKRELVETATESAAVDQALSQANNTYRRIALQNWLAQKYQQAGVVIP